MCSSSVSIRFVLFAAELDDGLTIMSCRITNPIFAAELHGGHLLLVGPGAPPRSKAMAL